MGFLRKIDLETPSPWAPDLFSHHAKRNATAMVPAGKEIFEKKFHAGSRWRSAGLVAKVRLAGFVNH
jgi:hypothetical protein